MKEDVKDYKEAEVEEDHKEEGGTHWAKIANFGSSRHP